MIYFAGLHNDMHKALNNKAAKAVFLMVITDVYPRIPFHLAVAFFCKHCT